MHFIKQIDKICFALLAGCYIYAHFSDISMNMSMIMQTMFMLFSHPFYQHIIGDRCFTDLMLKNIFLKWWYKWIWLHLISFVHAYVSPWIIIYLSIGNVNWLNFSRCFHGYFTGFSWPDWTPPSGNNFLLKISKFCLV